MKNMGNMMKQAQKLQSKMAKLQEELADKTVEASSGGGMVKVVAMANYLHPRIVWYYITKSTQLQCFWEIRHIALSTEAYWEYNTKFTWG